MALPRLPFSKLNIERQLASARDTWSRLKPGVRLSIVALGTAAFGLLLGQGLAVNLLPPQPEMSPVAVSIAVPAAPTATVSVNVPAPPAGQPAPSVPTVDNTAALTQMLNAHIDLHAAPLPSLLGAGQDGMLPRIADDGTEPWRAYSRPQAPVPAGAAMLAVVIVDAGLSQTETQPALAALPGAVDFAYDIYAPNLPDQITAARAAGHEVLLDVPMEPETYPVDDPGPDTLLTQLSPDQNLKQLHGFMARGPGAFALTSSNGNQFVTDESAMAPLLQDLKRRGLGWVDLSMAQASTGSKLATQFQLPIAPKQANDVTVLDTVLTQARLQAALDEAIAHARQTGSAILLAHTYPLSVKTLAAFATALPAQNVALVPVSALLAVPPAADEAPAATPVASPTNAQSILKK